VTTRGRSSNGNVEIERMSSVMWCKGKVGCYDAKKGVRAMMKGEGDVEGYFRSIAPYIPSSPRSLYRPSINWTAFGSTEPPSPFQDSLKGSPPIAPSYPCLWRLNEHRCSVVPGLILN
jgi:hypothetical protein